MQTFAKEMNDPTIVLSDITRFSELITDKCTDFQLCDI